MKLKIFIIIICCSTSALSQDLNVTYKFNPANKKIFYRGEPIVLDVIVGNKGHSGVFICPHTSILLYSITQGKDAFDLVPKYEDLMTLNLSKSKVTKFEGCDTRNPGTFLKKDQTFHFTKLLNNCLDTNRCSSFYEFLLPTGVYECTFRLFLSNGAEFKEKCQIEIKDDPALLEIMRFVKKLQDHEYNAAEEDRYSLENPKSIYYQCAHTNDPLTRDKLMLAMKYTIGKNASTFNFYFENIHKINNDVLLINMLSDFVSHFYPDSSQMKRYGYSSTFMIYDKILATLSKRDPEISEAFISAIKISDGEKSSSGFNLSSEELKKLKNYALQKR